jgi:hypothetical protein
MSYQAAPRLEELGILAEGLLPHLPRFLTSFQLVDWETGKLVDWETNLPIYQSTPSG